MIAVLISGSGQPIRVAAADLESYYYHCSDQPMRSYAPFNKLAPVSIKIPEEKMDFNQKFSVYFRTPGKSPSTAFVTKSVTGGRSPV